MTAPRYSSNDLSDLWKESYRKALGLRTSLRPVPSKLTRKCSTQFIRMSNLWHYDDKEENDDTSGKSDQWTQTAFGIQSNLETMIRWIAQKRLAFVSIDGMNSSEASLIQSTVASFTATTASEIESLRSCITNNNDSQVAHHQTSIVQILLSRLKEDVADPFRKFQAFRSRQAIKLWENPMQCSLMVIQKPKHSDIDTVLGLDSATEDRSKRQLFLPTRPTHRLHARFMETYRLGYDDEVVDPPTSVLFSRKKRQLSESSSTDDSPPTPKETKKVRFDSNKLPHHEQQSHIDAVTVTPDQLQQEALLLTASLQNDLDHVQKMEQTMVDITTLLSQFADLVTSQSESVYEIRDATATAKQNVHSGEEQLQDAKRRTQQSKHYMATAVASMGMMLLFFNWIRP